MADAGEHRMDPRFEKAITWAINLATSIALSVGAWFFSSMSHQMEALNGTLARLSSQVAVLEAGTASLPPRVVALEVALASQRVEIEALKDKVRRP